MRRMLVLVAATAAFSASAQENARNLASACAICHGEGLKGLANVPRLAGVHPIYLARQLYVFRERTRRGSDAALMARPVARLTDADIVDLSAYAASLNPE